MKEWQGIWDTSTKGREVYQVCKEVGADRLPLSFKGSQLLMGHGNLAAYLGKMGLHESGVESSHHARVECRMRERVVMRDRMRNEGVFWEQLKLRVNGKLNRRDVERVNEWGEAIILNDKD